MRKSCHPGSKYVVSPQCESPNVVVVDGIFGCYLVLFLSILHNKFMLWDHLGLSIFRLIILQYQNVTRRIDLVQLDGRGRPT